MKKTIIVILVLFIIVGCMKKTSPNRPSVYIFKVIDEYTNSPVSNCDVILEKYTSPDASLGNTPVAEYDTIGNTDSNGDFNYTFDKENIYNSQGSVTYSIHFKKNNYFDYEFLNLKQTHLSNNQLIKLNKENTLVLKVRRITPKSTMCSYEMWYYIENYDFYTHFFDGADTVGLHTYYYFYKTVKSNSLINIRWGSDCINIPSSSIVHNESISSKYDDTTIFNIDY